MKQEMKMIEEELKEINKFEDLEQQEDVLTFSESCGGFLTVICC